LRRGGRSECKEKEEEAHGPMVASGPVSVGQGTASSVGLVYLVATAGVPTLRMEASTIA
jgi:hypothetical protein